MKQFTMSHSELGELIQASNPSKGESMEKCIARATEVWKRIATRLGFDYKTPTKDPERPDNPRAFIAEPFAAETTNQTKQTET